MKPIWQEALRAAVLGLVLLALLLTVFGHRLQELETRLWWYQLMQQYEARLNER